MALLSLPLQWVRGEAMAHDTVPVRFSRNDPPPFFYSII
jgi:hypothetical protein